VHGKLTRGGERRKFEQRARRAVTSESRMMLAKIDLLYRPPPVLRDCPLVVGLFSAQATDTRCAYRVDLDVIVLAHKPAACRKQLLGVLNPVSCCADGTPGGSANESGGVNHNQRAERDACSVESVSPGWLCASQSRIFARFG